LITGLTFTSIKPTHRLCKCITTTIKPFYFQAGYDRLDMVNKKKYEIKAKKNEKIKSVKKQIKREKIIKC
jgi:hypothetical protein